MYPDNKSLCYRGLQTKASDSDRGSHSGSELHYKPEVWIEPHSAEWRALTTRRSVQPCLPISPAQWNLPFSAFIDPMHSSIRKMEQRDMVSGGDTTCLKALGALMKGPLGGAPGSTREPAFPTLYGNSPETPWLNHHSKVEVISCCASGLKVYVKDIESSLLPAKGQVAAQWGKAGR